MGDWNKTDFYLSLYQEVGALTSKTVSDSDISQFVQRLKLLGLQALSEHGSSKQKILRDLTEKARREYLYYWSLELNSESTTEDELSSIATSLGINEIEGYFDDIIISIKSAATRLSGRTQFEDLPNDVVFEIFSKLDSISLPLFTEVSHRYQGLHQNLISMSKVKRSDRIIIEASRNGYESIVRLIVDGLHASMLERDANDFYGAMEGAAYGGHEFIVRLIVNGFHPSTAEAEQSSASMLERGANDFYGAMYNAARGGHENIMRQMLDLGANDFNGAMEHAAYEDHESIVRLMLEKEANNFDSAMEEAAFGGYENIVQWIVDGFHPSTAEAEQSSASMLERGANDFNRAMYNAARGGHENIVRQMLDLGVNDFDGAMYNAATGGHENIVQWIVDGFHPSTAEAEQSSASMLERGANNFNIAMGCAARGGHKTIIDLLKRWKETHSTP